jgi:hypothetical protein
MPGSLISRLHGPGDAHRDRQPRRSHLPPIVEQKLLLVNLYGSTKITFRACWLVWKQTKQDLKPIFAA